MIEAGEHDFLVDVDPGDETHDPNSFVGGSVTTDEEEAAFRESFGYALNDPKHPTYHDRMSDAADIDRGDW